MEIWKMGHRFGGPLCASFHYLNVLQTAEAKANAGK